MNLMIFLLMTFCTQALFASTYTIKKNDSLWQIAKDHDISMNTLRKLNDLYKDTLFPGQKIYVPKKITNYTVKTGDSFNSIAQQFQTEIKYIITLNNLSENHVIEGQKLKIPITQQKESIPITQKTIKTNPITYKVRRGDTLSDIALKYKTTVPKLRKLNNKTSDSIYIGERLTVGNRKVVAQAPNKITYKVKFGDTLGQIALDYKVSQQDILVWNDKNSTRIRKGENLNLYTKNTPSKSKQSQLKTIKYTVKRGENLSFIATKFGASLSMIKSINNKKSSKILVGEILSIPVKSTGELEHSSANRVADTKLIRYKIKRGDFLDNIAKKYGVSRSQLLSWNNKKNTRIYIGETLKIYVATSTSTVPQSSKKAEYIKKKSATGIKSNKFKNVPLPVKLSQILATESSGRGVDIILRSKMKISAPIDATVQYAGYINALQNVVILQLSGDRTVVYAGFEKIAVKTGQEIAKGSLLGMTGTNKKDKAPTLYMEIRDNNKVVNTFHTYKELVSKSKK